MEEKRLQEGNEFHTFLSEMLIQHKERYGTGHLCPQASVWISMEIVTHFYLTHYDSSVRIIERVPIVTEAALYNIDYAKSRVGLYKTFMLVSWMTTFSEV